MNVPQTLLLVEDDPAFRRGVRAFLEDVGYRILEASNGQEGLDHARREKPDLVLTDLRMPVMDGLEFLGRLKSEYPTIPVIVVSGTGDARAQAAARFHGVVESVQKPIEDMGRLHSLIEQALASPR